MKKFLFTLIIFTLVLSASPAAISCTAEENTGSLSWEPAASAGLSAGGFLAPPDTEPLPANAIAVGTAEALAAIGGEISEGKYYYLANDIELTREWAPIENFRGTFDGRGKRIKNLFVSAASSREYAGLFGKIEAGGVTVKNVCVETGPEGITGTNAGGIAGFVYNTGNIFYYGRIDRIAVTNCYTTGAGGIYGMAQGFYEKARIGGLIGYGANLSYNSMYITDCYSTLSVSGHLSSGDTAYINAGGLVGEFSFHEGNNGLEINNCHAEGNVSAGRLDDNGGWLINYGGGLIGSLIAGENNSTVKINNCYALGNVSSSAGAGGLVGVCTAGREWGLIVVNISVTDCYAGGTVTAAVYGGGLFGEIKNIRNDGYIHVSGCRAEGYVSASSSGSSFAGGLIGCYASSGGRNNEITNCYASGNASAFSGSLSCDYTASAGGLIGEINSAGSPIRITGCEARGNISSAGRETILYAGGLIGSYDALSDLLLTDCFRFDTQIIKCLDLNGYPVSGETNTLGILKYTHVLNGWVHESNHWYYYQSNTRHTGWFYNGGVWYYLDPERNGVMVTGLFTVDGRTSEFDANGAWVDYVYSNYNGWKFENGDWYFFENGVMKSGWLLDGVWYFLHPNGVMASGEWLYDHGSWYYLHPGGAMASGQWLHWHDGTWYYLHPSGEMATGIVPVGGVYYIFDFNGKYLDTHDESTIEERLKVFSAEVIRLVNIERNTCGLDALRGHYALDIIAYKRAGEIMEFFSHTRPDGSGYSSLFHEYNVYWVCNGENIATGQLLPAEVVESWMNSPGHRANILNPDFTHIGVGVAADQSGRLHWVQIFMGI